MKIERWGWYSIGVRVILVLINLAIARVSGSLTVAAEAIHNAVDLVAAAAVLIGLKLSTRKSRTFPYGLYKLENVVAVGLAVMVFVGAYEIVQNAILTPPRPVRVDSWMLVGTVAATVLPLVFSHFELRAGEKANSPALVADAREYRIHVLTTGMVFVALLAQRFHLPLDRVAALVVVVVIGKTGWDLLADGMRVLLDASLDTDKVVRIRDIILSEPAVVELKWVTARNAGRFRFMEAEIALRISDLEKAEAIVRHIETLVRQAVPQVDRVVIHAEPMQRTHLWYAVPLDDREGTVSEHLGDAPFFALLRVRVCDDRVEDRRILPNPHRALDRGKGIRVAEWLVEQNADVVVLRDDMHGKGPPYVFGDAGIVVQETSATRLAEVVD
jgi:cation diffusion facilitator family transporter